MVASKGTYSLPTGMHDSRHRCMRGSAPTGWSLPPYPNNIDYTEVYKTESWALELYASGDDMRLQRLSTLRSHPSVLFPEEYHYPLSANADQVAALVAPIFAASLQIDTPMVGGRWFEGYADDMFQVLQQARQQGRNGWTPAVIVGNCCHGQGEQRFVVAADLVIAGLAEQAEWTVEEVRVARMLRRRTDDDGWMRECHRSAESCVSGEFSAVGTTEVKSIRSDG